MRPSSPNKQLYLLTDDGFVQRLLKNLVCMISFVVLMSSIPSLRLLALNLYWEINDVALSTAHRYAWWSLLALLSSSCCALQLILNAMSLGCAGFNTVLGPMRPTLLSFSLLLQVSSWYVAWDKPWQWTPTAISTILMICLSFLPEMLQVKVSSSHVRDDSTGHSNLSLKQDTTHTRQTTMTYELRMTSVGCAACMVTVAGVLDKIPQIQRYSASVETNRLVIECSSNDKCNPQELLQKFEEVGFPMELVASGNSGE